MKRLLGLLFILLLAVSLYAGVSFGYSASPFGEVSPEENFLGLEARGVLSFTSFRHIADVAASLKIGFGEDLFKEAGIMVSCPLCRTTSHPMNRFFTNITLWSPSVRLGGEYDGEAARAVLEFSPLFFSEHDFSYDFLSPYVFWNRDGSGWGITIVRLTAYIGG